MKEKLPTRREAIANSPNKPEFIKSIETLQRVGILMPMKDLELYHGRSGHGEEWKVEEINNSGNLTGNRNINRIPALHTGELRVARDFAAERTRRDNDRGELSRAEVHKIASSDPDASIFSGNFRWDELSKLERADASEAIRNTLPLPLEGSPLKFEDRHKLDGLGIGDFTENRKYNGYISTDLVDYYAKKYYLSTELANQVCGAINARMFLANYPEKMNEIVGAFTNNTGKVSINETSFPINQEYVANWLKKIHVVGEKKAVRSATLGYKPINTYMLFDFERVDTAAELKRQEKDRQRRFGKMALSMRSKNKTQEPQKSNMAELLSDPYSTPKELVKMAKKVPGFKEIFEADAGNWEKFSLGEHTETVLENFEYNYADRLPADMLPIMKLSLLVHDIGKSIAVNRGEKKNQEQYNVFFAEKFMREIGTNDRDREFVLRLIGPGKALVEDYYFRHRDKQTLERIKTFSANTFTKYTGKHASEWDAHGIFTMIQMIQTCDSAAYTDMALTQSKDHPGVVYRNAKVFNDSVKGGGLTRRKARLV